MFEAKIFTYHPEYLPTCPGENLTAPAQLLQDKMKLGEH